MRVTPLSLVYQKTCNRLSSTSFHGWHNTNDARFLEMWPLDLVFLSPNYASCIMWWGSGFRFVMLMATWCRYLSLVTSFSLIMLCVWAGHPRMWCWKWQKSWYSRRSMLGLFIYFFLNCSSILLEFYVFVGISFGISDGLKLIYHAVITHQVIV